LRGDADIRILGVGEDRGEAPGRVNGGHCSGDCDSQESNQG
jgi:hypothetical protein